MCHLRRCVCERAFGGSAAQGDSLVGSAFSGMYHAQLVYSLLMNEQSDTSPKRERADPPSPPCSRCGLVNQQAADTS
ncbi:hypothetical protein Mal15_20320 [Stieleria maiorica]|uniref:Uncharacterized protein n=1 Tax=Stieleria maiorica TaxID=2795974 RepID=A0A5B9MCN1_9BACT|nr:hypothetical protein Mal15_20320 [Stieleria maiorica]